MEGGEWRVEGGGLRLTNSTEHGEGCGGVVGVGDGVEAEHGNGMWEGVGVLGRVQIRVCVHACVTCACVLVDPHVSVGSLNFA